MSAHHMESPTRVSHVAQPRTDGEDRSGSPHRPVDHIILVRPDWDMAAGVNSLVGELVVMLGSRPIPLEISPARVSGPVPSSGKTTSYLQQKPDLSSKHVTPILFD